MPQDYARRVRVWVNDLDGMCRDCDRWIRESNNPVVRRRLRFARRGLGIARLGFLAILGLLGAATT